jgi:hypothetical protein
MMLPLASETPSQATRYRIPNPPAVPCKKQIWPSIDRACLTWTAPRPDPVPVPRRAAAAQQAVMPAEPAPVLQATIAAQEPPVSMAATWPPLEATLQPNDGSPGATSEMTFAPAPETAQRFVPPAPPASVAARPSTHAVSAAARVAAPRGRIAVTATGGDGRRRTIMIRPTNRQDVYYYATRR